MLVEPTKAQVLDCRRRSWSISVTLAVGVGFTSVVFFREIQAAIEVWNASTAYSHCYLVLPMAIYLIWERRHLVWNGCAQPDLRLALAAVPLTLLWFVAERLGIMEVRQLIFIAGIELFILIVLGRQLFSLISGPLLFLFFMVPFGAFITPVLQQFTATFSILGLNLLGIPNFSDGFNIETPAGVFFVAEACAGLRFLIAAIAFGVFYSLLSYSSNGRRIVFVIASIVVPVLANGFRALGIVVLGQVLGSAEAAAADHLVYGWIFFSIVMLLLIAGGHAFRGPNRVLPEETVSLVEHTHRLPLWCTLMVVFLLSLGPALAGIIDLTLIVPVVPEVDTIVTPEGCLSDKSSGQIPSNFHVFALLCEGERFEVKVQVFPVRSTSSLMTAERRRITQEMVAEDSVASVAEVPKGAGYWTVLQTTNPNRLTAYAGWVDGVPVTSELAGRVSQARDSIFGAAYLPALITVTTVEPANRRSSERRAALERMTAVLRKQLNLNFRMVAFTLL